MAIKEDQQLIETGPYRWMRHPIYTAYLLNYIGGGLLAGNLILTFIPFVLYAITVSIRMGQEEQLMTNRFGQQYIAYMERKGRLLPKPQV